MALHINYVVPFITTCFLAGRLLGRFLLGVGLGTDDWTMIAAFFAYGAEVGTSLGMVLNGFGQHVFWLSPYQIIISLKAYTTYPFTQTEANTIKFFYVAELFYIVSNTLTKLSLLLFFLRIFPNRTFRHQVQIVSLFVVLTGVALLIALTFQCTPVSGYWLNWSLPADQQSSCIDSYAVLYAGSGLSIFQNILILILPISTLWRLELSSRRKINVLLMFSMGSGVVVFSFLRLPSLIQLKSGNDISCRSLHSHI